MTRHGIPADLWTRTVPGLPRVRLLDAGVVLAIVVVLAVLALVGQLRGGEGAATAVDDTGDTAASTAPEPDRDATPQDDAATDSPVAVAEAQVLALTTLDRKDVETSTDALREQVTDDYRADFDDLLETYTDEALDFGGLAEGRIVASELVEGDAEGPEAEVEVTSTTRLTKKRTQPTERSYTFVVSLRTVDGRWRVAGMDTTTA